MATNGRYIADTDISNWANASITTDPAKKRVIDGVESMINRACRRIFYEKSFDIMIDGNGKNRIFILDKPDVLYVSAVYINGTSIDSSTWTWNEYSIYLDTSSSDSQVELKYLLMQHSNGNLFPRGRNNIRIVGTYGMPRKLDIDNISGTFTLKENITTASGASAYIKEINLDDSYLLIYGMGTTSFADDDEITGGTSEETADVNNSAGQVYYPPSEIYEAAIILAMYKNDNTLYTYQIDGSESFGAHEYNSKGNFITGVVEADRLLAPWISTKVIMSAV